MKKNNEKLKNVIENVIKNRLRIIKKSGGKLIKNKLGFIGRNRFLITQNTPSEEGKDTITNLEEKYSNIMGVLPPDVPVVEKNILNFSRYTMLLEEGTNTEERYLERMLVEFIFTFGSGKIIIQKVMRFYAKIVTVQLVSGVIAHINYLSVRSLKRVLYHAQKSSVGVFEKTFLSFCRFKHVQNKTSFHAINQNLYTSNSLNRFWSQFVPRLKMYHHLNCYKWQDLRRYVPILGERGCVISVPGVGARRYTVGPTQEKIFAVNVSRNQSKKRLLKRSPSLEC